MIDRGFLGDSDSTVSPQHAFSSIGIISVLVSPLVTLRVSRGVVCLSSICVMISCASFWWDHSKNSWFLGCDSSLCFFSLEWDYFLGLLILLDDRLGFPIDG